MSRKAFLYRLYPSRTQARLLDATLETCRFFYNDCLSERKTAYEERGESIGKYDQLRQVKERKATNPWAKNVHSHVLQTVVQDLDKAFDAFFRRVKAGETPGYPRFYRTAQRKLRVAQRRVARRTKGGKNRRKAVAILQRQHERISNQRKDFLNKLACDLTTRYDKIALEDLAITRMVHGNLAKSILDAGWGYLVQRLTHKAESAGRVVVLVDPRSTSKTCSQCGHVFESLALSDRWIDCACGLSLDRDHNAAINILNRGGQLRWGISSPVGGLPQEATGF
jgi:IS605 OrfB family transposase